MQNPWKNIWKDLIGSNYFKKSFIDKDVFIFVAKNKNNLRDKLK